MDHVDSLFNRLDDWRHLPSYQLERRADIFFSLYLAQALEDRYAVAMNPLLVPEFPVRIGTVWDGDPTINKSFKIDNCVNVFVQPNGGEEDVLSFEKFKTNVLKNADPVSLRFAESLTRW